jgi:hypothetical protein
VHEVQWWSADVLGGINMWVISHTRATAACIVRIAAVGWLKVWRPYVCTLTVTTHLRALPPKEHQP